MPYLLILETANGQTVVVDIDADTVGGAVSQALTILANPHTGLLERGSFLSATRARIVEVVKELPVGEWKRSPTDAA